MTVWHYVHFFETHLFLMTVSVSRHLLVVAATVRCCRWSCTSEHTDAEDNNQIDQYSHSKSVYQHKWYKYSLSFLALISTTETPPPWAFLMSYFHLLCASSFWMWLANLSLCTIANNASVSKTPALELWVTIDSFILSEDLWRDTVTHMNSDGGGIYKCKVLSNLLHSNCIVDILASLVSIIMTCLWAQTAEVKLYQ